MNSIYRALADSTRRSILAMLRHGDRTAGQISEAFDLSRPAISKHLSLLKAADLVQADRRGTTITYRLNASVLEEALLGLMDALGVENRGGDGGDG